MCLLNMCSLFENPWAQDQYRRTYGIKAVSDGMQLNFVTKTEYGSNYGSRIYMPLGHGRTTLYVLGVGLAAP